MLRSSLRNLFSLLATLSLVSAAEPEKTADGVILALPDYALKIQVCAPDILRVAAAPDRSFFSRESVVALPTSKVSTPWRNSSDEQSVTLTTDRLAARVDRASGRIVFLEAKGSTILAEHPGGRSLVRAEVLGQRVVQARQQWETTSDEALYGLGQTQSGLLDLKGRDLDLWQRNTEVFVPFFVSTRGYGILWDNTSFTRFGDLRLPETIPAERLFDMEGKPGGLTETFFGDPHFASPVATQTDAKVALHTTAEARGSNEAIHPQLPRGDVSVRWEGFVEPTESGRHTFQTYSDGGVRLWIDDKLVMDHWRQNWLPGDEFAYVDLTAGRRHRFRLEWVKDQGARQLQLRWKTPSPEKTVALWSEAGDGLDYYFVYGPNLDRVIAGYRQLTGAAPMMPKWAFGLWQSRQRYETAQQLTDAVRGFRKRDIPFDVIVQDWFYWPRDAWGSHQFDATRFPDPEGWVRQLHDELHARIMISVWGKFYPGTDNFNELKRAGYLYEPNLDDGVKDWIGFPFTFYDASIPEAQKIFWSQVDRALFKKGFDAWWLDATEPDLLSTPSLDGQRTHLRSTTGGSRIRVLNTYALDQSKAVYEGQRASAPDQRVFILTRSGFAGQQRYAAATWSGDITSTWTAMKKQIAAGLSLSASGVPYWTMDTGGFSVPRRFSVAQPKPEDVEEWRELNTRWFQFCAFVPLLRVHGEAPHREMWEFGGESSPAYQTMLSFDRLRYRFLPYVYSLAGEVTRRGSTILRPLGLEFPQDAQARGVADQLLFGHAFLVSPVTTYQARQRSVYLPAGTQWYDFWTGVPTKGGQTIAASAPFERIPVHVRAGSIIPFGPELRYTSEKPADPITLVVYAGADADFTLYEDDGLTYAYEKGAYTTIPLHWDDRAGKLTIGQRAGQYPGMLNERTFHVVVVKPDHPIPYSATWPEGQTVKYTGKTANVSVK